MATTFKFGNKNWAVKEDYVLAYNDENDNFKPLPFDFTRATTATYLDSDGLIKTANAGHARIDYTDNTDGHLLLEPSRTNLVPYSEDFTNSAWTKENISVSKSGTLANGLPKNTLTPDTTASVRHSIFETYTNTSSKVTASIFVDVTNSDFDYLALSVIWDANSTGSGVIVDLSDGTVTDHLTHATTTKSVDFVDYGNGIVKVSLTTERTDANYPNHIIFGPSPTATASSWNGAYRVPEFTANGTDVFVCSAAQLEAADYATSYIPTEGTSVTRNADVCNGAGSSDVLNNTEGVLYFEGRRQSSAHTTSTAVAISDGNTTNAAISLYYYSAGVAADVFNTSTTFGMTHSMSSTNQATFNKLAIKYKSGDTALWVNGTEEATKTNTFTLSPDMNEIACDYGSGTFPFYGQIKEIRVYNTALSDSELETLTT